MVVVMSLCSLSFWSTGDAQRVPKERRRSWAPAFFPASLSTTTPAFSPMTGGAVLVIRGPGADGGVSAAWTCRRRAGLVRKGIAVRAARRSPLARRRITAEWSLTIVDSQPSFSGRTQEMHRHFGRVRREEAMVDPNEPTNKIAVDPAVFRMEARPALFVMSPGAGFGQRYPLDQRSLSLGRSEACSIHLDQGGVSRKHVILTLDATGTVVLKDVGSTNGTYLNGRRLRPRESVPLQDGDQIYCGGVLLKFVAEGKSDHAFLEELRRQACLDALTGLANRRHFRDLGVAEFLRAQRYGRDLSLILLDFDDFKQLNDRYGHPCGDKVLAETSARLQQRLRRQDLLGRWGGDEFAVLLPETCLARASVLAHALRTTVANHAYRYQRKSFEVTISLGVATQSKQHRVFADLIASTDEQLLRAKRLGRNRVCLGTRDATRRKHAGRRPARRTRGGS
jgi:two-component system, cell cycle response regulator